MKSFKDAAGLLEFKADGTKSSLIFQSQADFYKQTLTDKNSL